MRIGIEIRYDELAAIVGPSPHFDGNGVRVMNEISLIAITLVTILIAGLAFYVNSQPSASTREERDRREALKVLKGIEGALSRNASQNGPAAWKSDVSPDVVTRHNREAVKDAEVCACLLCLSIFPPGRIREWRDDGTTACCPSCAIPMVVAESQTVPLTVLDLLQRHLALFLVVPTQDTKAPHEENH